MARRNTAKRASSSSLQIEEIRTLDRFMGFIEEQMSQVNGPLWFRGCEQSSHILLPGLYRHPTITDVARLIELEAKILGRFKQRSVPYQQRSLADKWEYLFFMQHFGVPTRLLDWTENPYIGLYFALSGTPQRYTSATPVYDHDAALWVLNPINWNRKVLEDIGWPGEILVPPDDRPLAGYEPQQTSSILKNLPIAIYGTYNSYRIVAQRGVFIMFGKSLLPMEQTYVNLRFPANTLIKIVIPADRIAPLIQSLVSIGITDSVVFPDLIGLAKETKRYFGFRL